MAKLDQSQQFLHNEYQSHIASATGMLGSLKADYNSASVDLSSATSASLSVASDPFNPSGAAVKNQTSEAILNDQQRMAHASAVAPNFQNQYQQWSMKDSDLMNQVTGNASQIGSALAGNGNETMNDLKSDANRDSGTDGFSDVQFK